VIEGGEKKTGNDRRAGVTALEKGLSSEQTNNRGITQECPDWLEKEEGVETENGWGEEKGAAAEILLGKGGRGSHTERKGRTQSKNTCPRPEMFVRKNFRSSGKKAVYNRDNDKDMLRKGQKK